jgi:hypothetical protein
LSSRKFRLSQMAVSAPRRVSSPSVKETATRQRELAWMTYHPSAPWQSASPGCVSST